LATGKTGNAKSMKLKTITYSESVETINAVGLKRWIRAEAEVEIEDHDFCDGEVPQVDVAKDAFLFAKQVVQKELDPHHGEPSFHPEAMPVHQVEKPLGTVEALIKDIESCREIKVLESYRIIASTKPELKTAYDNRLKELSQWAQKH
jgi:hypothetical protein